MGRVAGEVKRERRGENKGKGEEDRETCAQDKGGYRYTFIPLQKAAS